MLRPVALAKWLLIRAINDGRRTIVGAWPGRLAAPGPLASAFGPPRGERQSPLERLAKPCSAPCHVFAPFSTGVGQKTVDKSNAKPTIYRTVGKARSSKDAVGERFVTLPLELFPAGTAGPFVAEGDPKEEKKAWFRGSRLKIGLRRFILAARRAGIAEIVGVRRSQDPPAPAVVA